MPFRIANNERFFQLVTNGSAKLKDKLRSQHTLSSGHCSIFRFVQLRRVIINVWALLNVNFLIISKHVCLSGNTKNAKQMELHYFVNFEMELFDKRFFPFLFILRTHQTMGKGYSWNIVPVQLFSGTCPYDKSNVLNTTKVCWYIIFFHSTIQWNFKHSSKERNF